MFKRIIAIISGIALIFSLSSCTQQTNKSYDKGLSKVESTTRIIQENMDNVNSEIDDLCLEFVDAKYPEYRDDIEKAYYNETKRIKTIFKTINFYRDAENLPYLKYSQKLAVIAAIRAKEIAESEKFSHNRPDDKGYFSTLFEEFGFIDGNIGENLSRKISDPSEACKTWKKSKLHYENIINPNFTATGIGIAKTSNGNYVFVQEFAEFN